MKKVSFVTSRDGSNRSESRAVNDISELSNDEKWNVIESLLKEKGFVPTGEANFFQQPDKITPWSVGRDGETLGYVSSEGQVQGGTTHGEWPLNGITSVWKIRGTSTLVLAYPLGNIALTIPVNGAIEFKNWDAINRESLEAIAVTRAESRLDSGTTVVRPRETSRVLVSTKGELSLKNGEKYQLQVEKVQIQSGAEIGLQAHVKISRPAVGGKKPLETEKNLLRKWQFRSFRAISIERFKQKILLRRL